MKKRHLILILLAILLLSGCAVGFLTSYAYDSKVGKSTKTVYSPLFVSDSTALAEGAEFKVSVVITRRVEPISYSFLSWMGGLTPDDLKSKATAVVHFKNDSQQVYRITLRKIVIYGQEFPVKTREIVLKPGDRFSTKQIAVKAPTYDKDCDLDLFYELNGKSLRQHFPMKRKTMQELSRKKG